MGLDFIFRTQASRTWVIVAPGSSDRCGVDKWAGRGRGVLGTPSADNYRYCARFKINVNSGSRQLIRARINASHIEFRYQHYHRLWLSIYLFKFAARDLLTNVVRITSLLCFTSNQCIKKKNEFPFKDELSYKKYGLYFRVESTD
jgi:hypothetical protein